MVCDFKAYATRALRSAVAAAERRRYWADHGSTRYLWNQIGFKAAIDYVLDGQGIRMECYWDEANETDGAQTGGAYAQCRLLKGANRVPPY